MLPCLGLVAESPAQLLDDDAVRFDARSAERRLEILDQRPPESGVFVRELNDPREVAARLWQLCRGGDQSGRRRRQSAQKCP